jgi:hypothetical protein
VAIKHFFKVMAEALQNPGGGRRKRKKKIV